jgi:CubicO group peptidase (beta-lactamase class C family)
VLSDKFAPPDRLDIVCFESVGHVLVSISEMARLVRRLLNGGELDGMRVLDEDSVKAMCSHQVTTRRTIDGARHGRGYGPRVQELLEGTYIDHSGTAPGVDRTYVGLLLDRRLGSPSVSTRPMCGSGRSDRER